MKMTSLSTQPMFKFGSQNKMFLELQGKYSVGALSETTEADRVLFKTKNTQQKHSTYTVSAPRRNPSLWEPQDPLLI